MKNSYLKTLMAFMMFFILLFLIQTILSSMSTQISLRVPATYDWQSKPRSQQISCNRSHRKYDICSTNGPTVLDPTSSTIYVLDPAQRIVEKVRPFPRKDEDYSMAGIKEVTLISGSSSPPPCMIHHNVPALVFSVGSGQYTGNFFHDFNDGFIPLFITVNSVFLPDQDFILVISKSSDSWRNKYADLLTGFSKHQIINLDNDTATHCFPSATVGLITHGFVSINPNLIPGFKNYTHLRTFLQNAYGPSPNHPSVGPKPRQPRLVLASRSGGGGRVILNQDDVAKLAKEVGFEVHIFEPTGRTKLHESFGLISSSHAFIGVHGAALTHQFFLREGSVMMQIVPIGAESVADFCFGNLARELKLEYVEYKIGIEESSLIEKYGKEDIVVKDPNALQAKDWDQKVMDIYLREQNVRLDLVRFRKYLKDAYEKAKLFMDTKG